MTTSTGAIWLVMGGALTLLCGALLFAMQWLSLAGVATLTLLIVIVFLICAVIVTAIEWGAVSPS
ncbi:hypothetical protein RCH23_003443 [Cryobacterium sp. CAN_C3]|uniref:hypothetical protein n=1 Tax=unclassified Cryobacterium TaxID=2649013 RepID=UPI0018CA34FF|nr:hypothetical protein [Cryobacterium sp. CAN_C3]MEC5156037.1 hypothetical protein [Cryobacterium sp. CAN_C3]